MADPAVPSEPESGGLAQQQRATGPAIPPAPEVGGGAPPGAPGFGTDPTTLWEVKKDTTDPKKPRAIGVEEGKPRAEYFQTARMANDPALAAANDVPADQPIMSQAGAIPALLEAQKAAREGGKHKEYQAKRTKFEHEVGLLAAEDPRALSTMQAMCEKAKDWIGIMGGGDDAYAKLAQDSATGYGGAVGQSTEGLEGDEKKKREDANAQMMKTIMSGQGNVREMAMALQNFQTMMAQDLQDPAKRQKLQDAVTARQAEEEAKKAAGGGEAAAVTPAGEVAAQAEKKAATFTADELVGVAHRFYETGADEAKDAGGAAKALFSPTKEEMGPGGQHAQFGAAKKEDHDTKLPPMPAEAVESTRKLQTAQDSVDRLTTKITTLTGQKAAAEQAKVGAERQATQLEAQAGSAPEAQKAGLQAQAAAARSSVTGKNQEIARLAGELEQAKSALATANAQLTQAKAEAAQPATPGGKSTKAGEKSPMAWSTEKVEKKTEVQPDGTMKTVGVSETGIKLSEREVAAMERSKSKDTLPMIEGVKANIIDSSAPFISEANAADMPLKSGISGTTSRFMELATLMGQPPENARLGMVGHLVPIGAHSVHEINTAASGFGNKEVEKDEKGKESTPHDLSYDTKNPNAGGGPYTPEKMKPLTEEQLTACALKAGFASLAEANTPPKDEEVAAPPGKAAAAA